MNITQHTTYKTIHPAQMEAKWVLVIKSLMNPKHAVILHGIATHTVTLHGIITHTVIPHGITTRAVILHGITPRTVILHGTYHAEKQCEL
jgi:hypothetical protein